MIDQSLATTRTEAEDHVAEWCELHGVEFNPADPMTATAVDSVEAVIRASGSISRNEAFAVIQRVMLTHIDEAISLAPGDIATGW